MEAWLLADPEALEKYYGQPAFKRTKLPRRPNLEEVPKGDLMMALESATKDSKKGKYQKSHGFDRIGMIEPSRIRRVCPSSDRFFSELEAAQAL